MYFTRIFQLSKLLLLIQSVLGELTENLNHAIEISTISQLQNLVHNSYYPVIIYYRDSEGADFAHHDKEFNLLKNNSKYAGHMIGFGKVDCRKSKNLMKICRTGLGYVKIFNFFKIYDIYSYAEEDEEITGQKLSVKNLLLNSELPKIPTNLPQTNFDIRNRILSLYQTTDPTNRIFEKWQKSWDDRYNGGYPCPLQPDLKTYKSIQNCIDFASSWNFEESTVFVVTGIEKTTFAKNLVLSVNSYFRGYSAFHVFVNSEDAYKVGQVESEFVQMPGPESEKISLEDLYKNKSEQQFLDEIMDKLQKKSEEKGVVLRPDYDEDMRQYSWFDKPKRPTLQQIEEKMAIRNEEYLESKIIVPKVLQPTKAAIKKPKIRSTKSSDAENNLTEPYQHEIIVQSSVAKFQDTNTNSLQTNDEALFESDDASGNSDVQNSSKKFVFPMLSIFLPYLVFRLN